MEKLKDTLTKTLARITAQTDENEMRVVYPHFIASKSDLILSVCAVGTGWLLHENGCLAGYLRESGMTCVKQNRRLLETVFGVSLKEDRIERRAEVLTKAVYFDFLRALIFLASADLILPFLSVHERVRWDTAKADGETLPELSGRILPKLREYDVGWLVSSGLWYSGADTDESTVLFREWEEEMVRLSDGESTLPYRREVPELLDRSEGGRKRFETLLTVLTERFGLTWHNDILPFENGDVALVCKPRTEVLLDGYFRFLQAAVILSEVGDGGILAGK